ncbi:hypothetical protein B0I37DRAFT_376523 [Chaetomium sp. MPI-CAGE-AT-0009]|nr:hypothetical protein B0I37DRAFT_376523 [Chaetomium sp. MPI-CAGE-AT-0009]
MFGNWTSYDGLAKEVDAFHPGPFCWKAATPSLLAESAGLIVSPCSSGDLLGLEDFKRRIPRPRFEGPDRYYELNPDDNVIRRPRDGGFINSRKWYRVIHCQGIASIMGFANSKGQADFRAAEEKWRTLVYSSEDRPRLPLSRHRIIREAFNLHIFCSRIQRAGNHYLTRWKPFHITWFQILDGDMKLEQEQLRASSWKSGPLYGSTKGRLIQETCFTLAFLPHRQPNDMHKEEQRVLSGYTYSRDVNENGADFWTVLLLTPSAVRVGDRTKVGDMARGTPAMYVLGFIKHGLEMAADAWEDLRAHFNVILDDQHTMLDPRAHDELLFDDDTFSRSRLYFWAMDSLEMFITQIKDTISEWEDFWAAREAMIRTFEEVYSERCHELGPDHEYFHEPSNAHLGRIRDQISRLRDYQVQFEAFRAKTDALRGGLFNASSVIESRAATRLGENVKLLTYVSIFYLPLAFCAALWSINEGYDVVGFAVTSALVAIGTYVVVGNLESLTLGVRSVYGTVKQPIVDRMGQDPNQPWAVRSDRFNSFQPRRVKVKPSEWYIPLFWGLELLRALRIVKKPREDLEGLSAEEARPRSGAT